ALPNFLREHWDTAAVQEQVRALRGQTGEALFDAEAVNALLQQWIAQDRKDTPLKALQGIIWRAGYERGDYQAHMYPEVAGQLRAWRDQGLRLFVYSSGSIAAQKLFFGYSDAGDLTPLFENYFDTTSGHKQEVTSYRRITDAIGLPAREILFLSDIAAELDAARAAGLHTMLLDRDGVAVESDHVRVM